MEIRKIATAVLAAAFTAPFMAVSSASAADLGGDCCADLEERIAELEATAARKGNRKVSLAITGWVANILTHWDDGVESNTYISDAGHTLATNVMFTGQAQITPGWYAGYVLKIQAENVDPFVLDQTTDEDNLKPGLPEFASGVTPFNSFWFVKSDTLGQLSVGRNHSATDNVAIVGVDGSGLGSIFVANSPNFGVFKNMFLRRNGNFIGGAPAFRWDDIANCWHIGDVGAGISMDCSAAPNDNVRYDSPTWMGLTISTSWGEDDFWDVAMRYSGDWGDFKVNIGAGYSNNQDESFIVPNSIGGGLIPAGKRDVGYYQIGAYAQHVPTGLFLYGTYGTEEINSANATFATVSPSGFQLEDNDAFYVKAGIRQKWNPLGHTVLYGHYQQTNDMLGFVALANGATGSELNRWGLGMVQEIDAAAMSVWLGYNNYDGEITGPAATCAVLCGDLDEFQRVEFGGLILF